MKKCLYLFAIGLSIHAMHGMQLSTLSTISTTGVRLAPTTNPLLKPEQYQMRTTAHKPRSLTLEDIDIETAKKITFLDDLALLRYKQKLPEFQEVVKKGKRRDKSLKEIQDELRDSADVFNHLRVRQMSEAGQAPVTKKVPKIGGRFFAVGSVVYAGNVVAKKAEDCKIQ